MSAMPRRFVIHPASTTHLQVGAEAAAAGVGEDMIRLSVGLEDPADIIEDLDRALGRSVKTEAEAVENSRFAPSSTRALDV